MGKRAGVTLFWLVLASLPILFFLVIDTNPILASAAVLVETGLFAAVQLALRSGPPSSRQPRLGTPDGSRRA